MRRRTDIHTPRRRGIPGLCVVAAPLLLAGILPLPADLSSRWGWSGAWVYPVGDPHASPVPQEVGDTEYHVVRGVSGFNHGEREHDGVDLSNGSGGGAVRAAANGLVVHVGGKGWNYGYGGHVVLAHKLVEGGLAYSVYAHLAPGSASVKRGERVAAGRTIGKVGMTGRATSPHLHFEVRLPEDPLARWENAEVIDPLVFIASRLPTPRQDSTWSRPYLEWAECAALIPQGGDSERHPTRADWWRALLRSTRHPLVTVPASGESLRAAMVTMRFLEENRSIDPNATLGWSDMARVVPRARELGLRLPFSPVGRETRRADCRRELGIPAPKQAPEALKGERGPDRADMCLVLADLAGDPPTQKKKPKAATPKPAAKPVTVASRPDSIPARPTSAR